MTTAIEFADKISQIKGEAGLPVTEAIEPVVAEEIADWRGPLQDVQVRVRQMITKDVDKFMESAQAILTAAERSDWSPTVIQGEVKRWKRDIDRIYANFANSTKGFMALVKAMGIPTRRHSGKGKPLKRQGKKDWGKLDQRTLKKEIRDQVKRLTKGIHQFADDGSFMLRQLDRILKYKKPKDETVREEVGGLFQDFHEFKTAFGNKVMAPYYGLIGRLNAVRPVPLTPHGREFKKVMRKRPMKTMPPTPVVPSGMVAHAALPYDCDELREALQRDKLRASGAVLAEDDGQAMVDFIAEEIGLTEPEPVTEDADEQDVDLWDFIPNFEAIIEAEEPEDLPAIEEETAEEGDERPFDLGEGATYFDLDDDRQIEAMWVPVEERESYIQGLTYALKRNKILAPNDPTMKALNKHISKIDAARDALNDAMYPLRGKPPARQAIKKLYKRVKMAAEAGAKKAYEVHQKYASQVRNNFPAKARPGTFAPFSEVWR